MYKLMKVNLTEHSTFEGNGAMLISASDVIAFALFSTQRLLAGNSVVVRYRVTSM